ncbi:MAG: hypothetical protein H0V29_06910 [Thermoleophilaceae bacterium]|nr:hypothetical protein [Thermoleophilaceae bacterium]
MRLSLRLVPLLTIALFAGAMSGPSALAAKSPRLVYLDLFAQPEAKPKRIFVFANEAVRSPLPRIG